MLCDQTIRLDLKRKLKERKPKNNTCRDARSYGYMALWKANSFYLYKIRAAWLNIPELFAKKTRLTLSKRRENETAHEILKSILYASPTRSSKAPGFKLRLPKIIRWIVRIFSIAPFICASKWQHLSFPVVPPFGSRTPRPIDLFARRGGGGVTHRNKSSEVMSVSRYG